VCALGAQGLSNREIAQAMFVTTHTVAVHLTHAYRKLDITSRSELATALERDAHTQPAHRALAAGRAEAGTQ
jgi:DNA-binding CsgD family transcriptional regulator